MRVRLCSMRAQAIAYLITRVQNPLEKAKQLHVAGLINRAYSKE